MERSHFRAILRSSQHVVAALCKMGRWQGPSADMPVGFKYLEPVLALGLTWQCDGRKILRRIYCQLSNGRISCLSIRQLGLQISYCEGGLNDANSLAGQRHPSEELRVRVKLGPGCDADGGTKGLRALKHRCPHVKANAGNVQRPGRFDLLRLPYMDMYLKFSQLAFSQTCTDATQMGYLSNKALLTFITSDTPTSNSRPPTNCPSQLNCISECPLPARMHPLWTREMCKT